MSLEKKVSVSVVVPTYRRPDLLERCLKALQHQTLTHEDYEIIVCDDGPSEQAAAVVDAAKAAAPGGPVIRYLRITDTQGPAAARNRGWQSAHASIIAFTDDDTVPDSHWLFEGLQVMQKDVDAATGCIVMPLPDKPADIEQDAARLTRAEFVTANCFIRREALLAVHGFDERFGMAWREDSDLHFALLKAGFSITRAPRAVVVHPLRETPFAAGIGMQKKVLFDVLLYCKHPRLYRERIRKRPPWLYIFISALLVLAITCALVGEGRLAVAALALWGMVTLWFFLKRLSGSALTARNAAELLVTSIIIPPLSIFWRLVGVYRFGGRLP